MLNKNVFILGGLALATFYYLKKQEKKLKSS